MKQFSLLILFTLSTLCSSAQPTVERDSSIYVTSSRLYRMGESLIVSMQVDIKRTLLSNESVVLVPQLSDSLENFMQLPAIYINGRKQHIVFLRETGRHEKDYEEVRRNNNRSQVVRYLRSVPYHMDGRRHPYSDRKRMWLRSSCPHRFYLPHPAAYPTVASASGVHHSANGGSETP